MPTSIMRDEVQQLIREENAQLVDVLPPAEYKDEHIADAVSIPLRQLEGWDTRWPDRNIPSDGETGAPASLRGDPLARR